MDSIHKSSLRLWIGKTLKIKEFQNQWIHALSDSKNNSLQNLQIVFGDNDFSEIERECSIDSMKSEHQDLIDVGTTLKIPENVNLKTLWLQEEDKKKRRNDHQYESVAYINSKCRCYPSNKMHCEEIAPSTTSTDPVVDPDVVLTVQIFKPEKRFTVQLRNQFPRFPVFLVDQEFVVLGSQCLTDLRDKIGCISDKAIPGDYSDMPDFVPEFTCKDIYKSGFFYINGVFYNDMRHSDCRDYSEIIIKWAEAPGRGIGPFTKALMEESKFIDLELQLGYPYVYVHQGYCEHLMVFSDLAMYSKNYCNNRNLYPISIDSKRRRGTYCMVCRIHLALWIVYDSKRVPENPFLFCKSCFLSYNYDSNNQKIENFRAYHYVDRSLIL